MAYKANIKIEDTVFEDVIFRIQKISTANSEYEFFETVNDPEHPEIAEKLSWTNRFENTAVIYCWIDQVARENRAHPFHWFNIEFDWTPNEKTAESIYERAYKKIKELYPDGVDV